VIDPADREQIAWTYSGISAGHPIPEPHGMHALRDLLRVGHGLHDVLRAGTAVPLGLAVGGTAHDRLVA
jgi:hypothetical protein